MRLADRLSGHAGRHPLVLAIPRGAVPMGRIVAERLGGELDVVLVRKLGAPGNPEFAIGALDETGWSYVSEHAQAAGADPSYIEQEKQAQLQCLRQRRLEYTRLRPPVDPSKRTVIVLDDGLATGSTMIAALNSVRAKQPARLICAVPVAPLDAVQRLASYADEVVCLESPLWFYSVGQFYADFPQVSDADVMRILEESGAEQADFHC